MSHSLFRSVAMAVACLLMAAGASEIAAQVLTVPDAADVSPRRLTPAPRQADCPKDQICTVCIAGCGVQKQTSIVSQASTPPPLPASDDPEVENAQIAGLNRHPASVIVCGPQGTCRGFGGGSSHAWRWYSGGWHLNDVPSYPRTYRHDHTFWYFRF